MIWKILTLIAILSNIWVVKREVKNLSFLKPKIHRRVGGMLIATYTVSLFTAIVNMFTGIDMTLIPWFLYLIMLVVVSGIEYAYYDYLVKQEEEQEQMKITDKTTEE